MIKKILYIAFKYEYGKEANGLAMNYKAWYENFVSMGYDAEAIFYEDYSKYDLQARILEQARKTNPDLIFFVLQKDQIDISTLKILKEKGFFTANFFGDDQWRFDNYTINFANHFCACITTDKFSLTKYRDIGQNNIVRSQWASLDNNVINKPVAYKYDVSFIGGYNRYRGWFVDALAKTGVNVHCFGSGWENGRVSYEQVEEIFSSSKINLNISNSESYDVRYLLSSLKAFLLGLKSLVTNGKHSSQTKARNFEIPVQGGFQLTDFVPSLDDYFEIGKELSCYNSVDEAAKLIKYYLINDAERESIKLEGIKRARNAHTFKHRIMGFMKELEAMKFK